MNPSPQIEICNAQSAILPPLPTSQRSRCRDTLQRLKHALSRRPELLVFLALLAIFNAPVLTGSCLHSMMFLPHAVCGGEWWRLFTHPFVHVTWYHLLLDGAAFLALYHSLIETSVVRRLLYVFAAGAGSLLVSWASAPRISGGGLCGLSGIAHGLMAVSALELVGAQPPGSTERRIGQVGFALVVGKAALEALSGRMFFTFLHFGLMGDPVAVSHAGGIIGSLLAMLLLRPWRSVPALTQAHMGLSSAHESGQQRICPLLRPSNLPQIHFRPRGARPMAAGQLRFGFRQS